MSAWSKKVHEPFGYERNDPIVVCINMQHMKFVQYAFQLRAYYCLPFNMLAGVRTNKIIVFKQIMLPSEEERFDRWVNETLRTKLNLGGAFYLV